MEKFKQEELMQYLYGETSTTVTLAIEEAMQFDWELQDEVKTLKRTIKQLDLLKVQSPRSQSIEAIINYARATDVVTEG